MTERKPIEKRIRFEVFKRDMFTCQYCGRKVPDVVLQCDHIKPLAKGGKNEITNLITSCFDCNSGKSDKQLSDNSSVVKQQKQLELIQEKKEQLEMIFKWKESLDKIDKFTFERIAKQIELRMKPNTLDEKGKQGIRSLIKKYSVEKILHAIEIAAEKYLQYNKNGGVTQESAENYIKKISGILYTESLGPVQQKIVYLKGIVRNQFNVENSTTISMLINDYVKALKSQGYNDEDVIKDFEDELIPKTFEIRWWSEWKKIITKWTDDVNNWKKDNKATEKNIQQNYDKETLASFAVLDFCEIETCIKMIMYLGKQFPNFDQETYKTVILSKMLEFVGIVLKMSPEEFRKYNDQDQKNDFLDEYIASKDELTQPFTLEEDLDKDLDDYFLLEKSSSLIDKCSFEIFEIILHTSNRYSYENKMEILRDLDKEIITYQNKTTTNPKWETLSR